MCDVRWSCYVLNGSENEHGRGRQEQAMFPQTICDSLLLPNQQPNDLNASFVLESLLHLDSEKGP